MPTVDIHTHGDGCWPDIIGRDIVHVTDGLSMARLTAGMKSGASSVGIRINLPDGRIVIAELSMAMFLTVAAAFRGAEDGEADRLHAEGSG